MMAVFIKHTIMISVILLMFGVGMNTSLGQIINTFRQFGAVLRGVLANFLIVPLLIYLVLLFLPLSSEVKIGIMLMAAAPVAPMAPQFVAAAGGDVAYGVGLMVVVALLSVVLTPPDSCPGVAGGWRRYCAGSDANRSDSGSRATDTYKHRSGHPPATPKQG